MGIDFDSDVDQMVTDKDLTQKARITDINGRRSSFVLNFQYSFQEKLIINYKYFFII